MDETEALRTEVAELRAEVDRLRAWVAGHTCAPLPSYWPQPTVGTPPSTPPLIGPGPTYYQPTFPINVCAGNYVTQTWTLPNVAGANPPAFHLDPSAFTAGCAAPPQTLYFSAIP